MKLPGRFMAVSDRIIADTNNPLLIFLNASVITNHELAEIEQWCKANDCCYYLVGMVRFPDEKSKMAFFLRWM